MKNVVFFLSFVIFVAGCQQAVSRPRSLKHSESRPLFGTIVRLDTCYEKMQEKDIQKAFEQVWRRLDEINWRMYVLNDQSDVAKINNSRSRPVSVGGDTYELLQKAVALSKLTEGAFDITVYPLIEAWKKAERDNRLPTSVELKMAKRAVGSSNIKFLDKNRVRLVSGKTKVDLNGIGCGYAADEAQKIFRENGFNNFLVDTGGELFASGLNCEGVLWRIGVRNPQDNSGITDVIELRDGGVSTSGNYTHYFKIEGHRWSHIINPVTGYPQDTVVSATVIAPSATEADAASTALCVLGGKRGVALIDSLGEGWAAMAIETGDDGVAVEYKSARYEALKAKESLPKR